jgi:putative aldouronate transport system permease protein
LGTLIGLLCTGMLAFALTRKGVAGKKFFNQFFLFTMYFSGGLVPIYIQINNLGLTNNFLVFILPTAVNVFYMIIIKSYFVGLPPSVEEVAKIDGCNELQIFFKIIVPMSIPVFAAIGVYYAVWHWNSWWDNYIYANRNDLITLQLLLVRIIKDADTVATLSSKGGSVIANPATANPMGVRMATTMIVTAPILVTYPFFQRYFISGITIGAVKG